MVSSGWCVLLAALKRCTLVWSWTTKKRKIACCACPYYNHLQWFNCLYLLMLVQFHCISRIFPFWSLSVEFIDFNGLMSVAECYGYMVSSFNKWMAEIPHLLFIVSGMFRGFSSSSAQTLISLNAQIASVYFFSFSFFFPTTNSLFMFKKHFSLIFSEDAQDFFFYSFTFF